MGVEGAAKATVIAQYISGGRNNSIYINMLLSGTFNMETPFSACGTNQRNYFIFSAHLCSAIGYESWDSYGAGAC